MEDYDQIYKRIHQRKHLDIQNEKPKIKKEKKNNTSLFKFFNRILGVLCLILAFLIYAYKDPNANFINQTFNTNISFEKLNQFMSKVGTTLTNFFTFGTKTNTSDKDLEVSANSKFVKISEFYYTNEDKTAYSFDKGTILSISEDTKGYQIIVKHDNGYLGIYEELDATLVKEYDRINKFTKLGYFETNFAIYFIKNGVTYSYEDLVKD